MGIPRNTPCSMVVGAPIDVRKERRAFKATAVDKRTMRIPLESKRNIIIGDKS